MTPKSWAQLQVDLLHVAYTLQANLAGLREAQRFVNDLGWGAARYELYGRDYRVTILNRTGLRTRVYSPDGTFVETRRNAKAK